MFGIFILIYGSEINCNIKIFKLIQANIEIELDTNSMNMYKYQVKSGERYSYAYFC